MMESDQEMPYQEAPYHFKCRMCSELKFESKDGVKQVDNKPENFYLCKNVKNVVVHARQHLSRDNYDYQAPFHFVYCNCGAPLGKRYIEHDEYYLRDFNDIFLVKETYLLRFEGDYEQIEKKLRAERVEEIVKRRREEQRKREEEERRRLIQEKTRRIEAAEAHMDLMFDRSEDLGAETVQAAIERCDMNDRIVSCTLLVNALHQQLLVLRGETPDPVITETSED